MTFCLCSCGKDKSSDTQAAASSDIVSEDISEATTGEPAVEVTTEEPAVEVTLKSMEKHLLDSGVISGERTEPLYSFIGAINGFKYLDSNVEVYEYDESSDTYKDIVSTKQVSGINIYAINGPLVLVFSNDEANHTVIDAFNSL